VQDLDRDLALQDGIASAEHLAHAARGDTIDDVVPAVEGGQREGEAGTACGPLGDRASGDGCSSPSELGRIDLGRCGLADRGRGCVRTTILGHPGSTSW
jgi:hypothetical protein